MTAAQHERAALVDTMRGVGPDAPTLCGDWTTRDLAAHLVVREGRLDAAPGITIPFLADYTDKVQNQVAAVSDWDELLDKIAVRAAAAVTVQAPRRSCQRGRDVHPPRGRAARAQPVGSRGHSTTAPPRHWRGRCPLMARMALREGAGQVSLRTPEGKTLATTARAGPDRDR